MKVKTKNPDRGPLLIISTASRTTPCRGRSRNASYKRQKRNKGVTEIVKIPDRGHSLTIDHGWRRSPTPSLKFVQRFVKP